MIKRVWNSNDIFKRHNLHILLIKRILMMSYAPVQPFQAMARTGWEGGEEGTGSGKNQQTQNKMFTANKTKTPHHTTKLIIKS